MYLEGRPTKKNTRFFTRWLIPTLLVTSLAACGGGGGNGSSDTNEPPTVVNQAYTVNRADTLVVNQPGVLENSTDQENDQLSAQVVTGPTHGTLTLNPNGSFNYMHDGNSSEDDSFVYIANDGANNSNQATVTIDVLSAPVTSSACIPIGDLPVDLNDHVSDDDTQLTFTVMTPPTQGTLNLSSDGSVLSYSLNPGNGTFRGVDSFTYEVDDNNGGTAPGSVNLIVGKIRIMPLGDSITKGVTRTSCSGNSIPEAEQIGYRAKLYQNLVDKGYVVDLVGNLSNGAGAAPPIGDPNHQGIGGEEASAVAANIEANLNLAPADIILLHVGTNNINFDDPDVVNGDIQTILDNIDTWEGTNNPVTVMLSTIIERSTDPLCDPNPTFPNANVATLNALINTTAANRQATDDIVLVDQHNVVNFTTDISVDGVHPNQNGYDNMADEWFAELTDTDNSSEIVSLFETLKCPVGN